MPPVRLGTGGVHVQPAAELRHVQRQHHGRDVSGALRACPNPVLVELSPARCLYTLLSLIPHLASSRICPPFDSAVGVGLQPAVGFRHAQSHNHVGHVSGALRAYAAPNLHAIDPSSCTLWRRRPQPSQLSQHSAQFVCPPFDSAGRVGLQPAGEFRHLQSEIHESNVSGTLRRFLPPISSRTFSTLHTVYAGPLPTFNLPRPAFRPTLYALRSTRQSASAFNQPLSFDMSSVTSTGKMFQVRSAHTLRTACTAT